MSRVTVIHAPTDQYVEAQTVGGFRTSAPSVLFDWDNPPKQTIPISMGDHYWVVRGSDSMKARLKRKSQDPQTLKHRLDFRR